MNIRRFSPLFAVLALAIAFRALPLDAALSDNLVGYWPLNETSGGVAHDASGYGHDGTLVNFAGNQGTWVQGQTGGALQFAPSVRQYVQIPDFTKPTTSFTLSTWVWANSLPRWGGIAANWDGSYGTFTYSVFSDANYLSCYFADGSSTPGIINIVGATELAFPVSGPAFATNAWHFVSVVMDSSTRRVQFYRDGLALAHKNYSGSFYPAPLPGLTIGGDPADPHLGQGFWDGSISDLALWTRALSPSELTSIYNAGLAGQPLLALVPEPSPISLSALAVVLIGSCAAKTRRSKVLL